MPKRATSTERDRDKDWSFTITGSGNPDAAREAARTVLADIASQADQEIIEHAWADPTHNEPIAGS